MTAPAFVRARGVLLSLVLLVLLAAGVVRAGQQAGYDLSWWSVDGGGVTFSSGGGYTLGSTAGQPDANVLHGGAYTLAGGFWGGGETIGEGHEVYLPLVMRSLEGLMMRRLP
jgi:hypothetical protein